MAASSHYTDHNVGLHPCTGIVQSADGSSAMAVTGVMLIALGNRIGGLFAS
jgi:hypothetical protein